MRRVQDRAISFCDDDTLYHLFARESEPAEGRLQQKLTNSEMPAPPHDPLKQTGLVSLTLETTLMSFIGFTSSSLTSTQGLKTHLAQTLMLQLIRDDFVATSFLDSVAENSLQNASYNCFWFHRHFFGKKQTPVHHTASFCDCT
jgi:hypothetical protein